MDIPLEITDKECNKSDTGFSEKVDLTGVKVLLAEDNELNAEIAAVQLEEFGMNVDYCHEVVQRWISPDGKVTDMALLRGFLFCYCEIGRASCRERV